MLYLFSLPTDGWLADPPNGPGGFGYTYQRNLLGMASGLQPGDHAIAIEDVSFEQQNLQSLSDKWRAGNVVRYTVMRDTTRLDVSVPLENWRLGPAFVLWLEKSGGTASTLGNLAFLAIAGLAFLKRPGDHSAQALVVLASLINALVTATGVSTPATNIVPGANLYSVATILGTFTVLFPPSLLRLAMVFPRQKPIVARHPWLESAPYLIGLSVIPLFLATGGAAGYLWTVLAIVGMITILVHSAFTMRDALSRAQLLWGLWGVILGMLMFLSTYLITFGIVSGVAADVINFLVKMSFGVIGVTLAIAILRYRLFDINIILRRTVTYAILSAALAIIYFGANVIAQGVIGALGGQRNEVAIVASTLAVAALFSPVRRRVQNAIDRRFNRQRYDADKVVADFAEYAAHETDLAALQAHIVGVVAETIQPRQVTIWVRGAAPPDGRPMTEDGRHYSPFAIVSSVTGDNGRCSSSVNTIRDPATWLLG